MILAIKKLVEPVRNMPVPKVELRCGADFFSICGLGFGSYVVIRRLNFRRDRDGVRIAGAGGNVHRLN